MWLCVSEVMCWCNNVLVKCGVCQVYTSRGIHYYIEKVGVWRDVDLHSPNYANELMFDEINVGCSSFLSQAFFPSFLPSFLLSFLPFFLLSFASSSTSFPNHFLFLLIYFILILFLHFSMFSYLFFYWAYKCKRSLYLIVIKLYINIYQEIKVQSKQTIES